jgi:hypothetical protein
MAQTASARACGARRARAALRLRDAGATPSAGGPPRGVGLWGIRRGRLRSRGWQSVNARGVVAGDRRLSPAISDRPRATRSGPEGAQSNDILGSDGFQRPGAARAEVVRVSCGVAVTPDAGAAGCAPKVRHGISGPWRSVAARRRHGRSARAHAGGPRWSASSCRRERGTARVARGGSEPRPRACSRLDHGLTRRPSIERSAGGPTAGEAPGPAAAGRECVALEA